LKPGCSSTSLQPRVVGEFDDGALMKAFGREGRGVFVSPSVVEAETCAVRRAGHRPQRRDARDFYAISVERRITHPCVAAITQRGGTWRADLPPVWLGALPRAILPAVAKRHLCQL
jgi:hypothetical protein